HKEHKEEEGVERPNLKRERLRFLFLIFSASSLCALCVFVVNSAPPFSGVKDCIAAAKPVYELLGAKEKLAANYPDCAHDFPPDVRKVAYQWLDRWLK